jgi:hypothetical protein
MHSFGWYALGLGTAMVASVTGKPVGKALRPAAKSAIKNGLAVSREVQRRFQEARSTFDDLAAEAEAELDLESPGQDESAQP